MKSANPGALRLTQGTAWALKAMAGLALNGSAPVAIAALAKREDIPPAFLAKIVRPLVRARLLEARGGRGGGVRLASPAAEMPLLAIVEACEGTYARASCLYYPIRTCLGMECEVYCPVRAVEESTRRDLARTTLKELADSLAVHPDRPDRSPSAAAAGPSPA